MKIFWAFAFAAAYEAVIATCCALNGEPWLAAGFAFAAGVFATAAVRS